MSDFDPYYEWLGIAPEKRPLNHYLLLGLEVGESDRTRISSAADRRVAYLRSLQQGKRAKASQQLLNEVAEAVAVLLNDEAKAAYDASLPQRPAASSAPLAQPLQTTLSIEALTGPMAPVVTQQASEPAAPPLTTPATPAATAPPIARPADESPAPVRSSQAASQSVSDEEDAAGKVRLLIVGAAVISAIALLLSLALGVASWLGWFGKAADVEAPRNEVASNEVVPHREDPPSQTTNDEVVVVQEGDGALRLSPSFALLDDGLSLGDVDGSVVVLGWTSSEQAVEWRMRLVKPGVFQAKVTYASAGEASAGALIVKAGDKSQQVTLRGSGGPDKFVSETFYVAIPRFGVSSLTLQPGVMEGEQFITLKSLDLTPGM